MILFKLGHLFHRAFLLFLEELLPYPELILVPDLRFLALCFLEPTVRSFLDYAWFGWNPFDGRLPLSHFAFILQGTNRSILLVGIILQVFRLSYLDSFTLLFRLSRNSTHRFLTLLRFWFLIASWPLPRLAFFAVSLFLTSKLPQPVDQLMDLLLWILSEVGLGFSFGVAISMFSGVFDDLIVDFANMLFLGGDFLYTLVWGKRWSAFVSL